MNGRSLWKFAPSPGPILGLLLIGLVLLSGLLYYRAVKIQRFLEPALALSQPRNEFTKNIKRIFEKEFGTKPVNGLKVKTSSILIEKPLLYAGGALRAPARADLQKLARIFLSLMKDEHMRSEISLVLIIGRFPVSGPVANIGERAEAQRMVGLIQDALFQAEPELGMRYAASFVCVAQPASLDEGNRDVVELRIIPSEFLHIEVLERLEKYAD